MGDDVISLLDAAVQAARDAGRKCDGWTMQSCDDGYVAWLYVEEEDGQASLVDAVEILPDAVAAAKWCLTQAQGFHD